VNLSSAAILSRLPKLFHWSKILGKFATVQLLVQMIGLASGILLVRWLSKTEYAFFTIANSMQGTMSLLADVGISGGLSAIGGRVWHDRYRFGQLINTALHLRRTLLIISVLAVTPLLFWLLHTNGAKPVYAIILTAILLAGIMLQVTNGVLVMIPRLQLHTGRLQKLDLMAAVARLGLILAVCLIWLNAATGVLAAVVAFAIQFWVLQRWAHQCVDTKAPMNEEDRQALWAIVKKQAPNDLYFCIQSQIMVWLISIFGNANNVAEVGALSRLAVIFAVINSTMTEVVLPRFARCQTAATLKRRYLQIVSGFVVLGAFLVLLATLFPTQFLMILGPKYMHLKSEVVLMVLSSAVGAVSGVMWSCNFSKGWIPPAFFVIPFGLSVQIFLLCILDISSVRGVLLMNVFLSLSAVLVSAGVFWTSIRKL
jgi:O-antigen/teichoic acid export membrane protein